MIKENGDDGSGGGPPKPQTNSQSENTTDSQQPKRQRNRKRPQTDVAKDQEAGTSQKQVWVQKSTGQDGASESQPTQEKKQRPPRRGGNDQASQKEAQSNNHQPKASKDPFSQYLNVNAGEFDPSRPKPAEESKEIKVGEVNQRLHAAATKGAEVYADRGRGSDRRGNDRRNQQPKDGES